LLFLPRRDEACLPVRMEDRADLVDAGAYLGRLGAATIPQPVPAAASDTVDGVAGLPGQDASRDGQFARGGGKGEPATCPSDLAIRIRRHLVLAEPPNDLVDRTPDFVVTRDHVD